MYPFERFTEKAKKVLTLAQDEAEKYHLSYIDTEQVLLGLLRETDGLAAKVLAALGLLSSTCGSSSPRWAAPSALKGSRPSLPPG